MEATSNVIGRIGLLVVRVGQRERKRGRAPDEKLVLADIARCGEPAQHAAVEDRGRNADYVGAMAGHPRRERGKLRVGRVVEELERWQRRQLGLRLEPVAQPV